MSGFGGNSLHWVKVKTGRNAGSWVFPSGLSRSPRELARVNIMSDADFESFNDPGLRSAVRRVWGDEQASAELRQKLQEMFPKQNRASRHGRAASEPFVLRFRSTLYGLAAAAVFLLAVGLAFQDWVTGQRHARIAPRALLLPVPVANDLVAEHDSLAKAKNRNPLGGTDEAINARFWLQDRLGFPVLAMDLAGTNWKFRSGTIGSVNGAKSGQLLFELDGKKFVSVFSMPRSTVSGSAPACSYAQVNGSHPLAGFASTQAFYCLVASSTDGSLTLDDVRSIRDSLRPAPGVGGAVADVMFP